MDVLLQPLGGLLAAAVLGEPELDPALPDLAEHVLGNAVLAPEPIQPDGHHRVYRFRVPQSQDAGEPRAFLPAGR